MQSSLLIPDSTRDPQPGDALILFLPVFLSLGIGLYFALPFEPAVPVLWGGFSSALLVGLATIGWRDTYTWRWVMALCVMATLGMGLAQMRTHALHTNLLPDKVWGAEIAGTIQSMERAGAGWRVVLQKARINHEEKEYTLRLSIRGRGFKPHLGQDITVMGSLMPPSPPFVPGAFDFQRHAYFQGLSGYGYTWKIVSQSETTKIQKTSALENYRIWIADKVYGILDKPEAGVVTALLNGQRAGIDRQTTKELQQSGLQHIISISGLHVGLLAGIVFYVTRLLMAFNMRLALTWPIKKIAAGFALVSIIIYMLIVGLEPATVRSVIMTGIVLIAVLVDREAINLRLVAIAAIILLLWHPESVLDIGFQLSFAAVTGLVAFYQYTADFWQRSFWNEFFVMKVLRVGFLSILTTIIATISTAPLVLLHFQQIPMLSMLANALATPVVTFLVMPGTFLSYILLPFPFVGEMAVKLMGLGVDLVLDISRFVAHLPSSVWQAPALPQATVFLLLLGLFILIALKGLIRYTGIVFCVVAIIPLFFNPTPDILMTPDRVVMLPDPNSDILRVEGKIDSFQKNILLQLTGKKRVEPWDCDAELCDMTLNGKSIRLVRTVPALRQACAARKDVVLTRYYLDRRCKNGVVVDRHDLEKKEGAVLWVDDTITVGFGRTVKTRRPWQQNQIKQRWYSREKFVK